MAIELAKAYVQIVPSTQGLANTITKEFESAGASAGASGGEHAGNSFTSTLGKIISGAAIAKGAQKLVSTITDITKAAVNSYADYEQLVGGVETLFGTTRREFIETAQAAGISTKEAMMEWENYSQASDTVMANAANAFKTAGMSANDYMETVTGFSASLLQGLEGDTHAAAELADVAITDMADNANKMGTDMEAIKNAYQGFAKQNFTMLDNLKLGYGGTAAEMARLINDSGVLGDSFTATAENVKDIGFDTMIEAIHAVQTEMGITGTTALEASTTIQGSAASMKAAWENLLVGMADGSADLSGLIGDLADSVVTFGGNIIPVIEQALQGIATVVTELAPMIVAMLPGIVDAILPGLLDSAMSLVNSIIAVLPSLLQTIIEALLAMLPQIVQAGLDLFVGLIGAMPEIISTICAALPDIITQIVTTLANNIPAIVQAGVTLLTSMVQNLPQIITGIVKAVPQIISALVKGVVSGASQLAQAGRQLMQGLINGITSMVSNLWSSMTNAVGGIVNGAKRLLGIASPSKVFAEIGAYTMEGFAEGIVGNEGLVSSAMQEASRLATGSFSSAISVNAAVNGSGTGSGADIGDQVAAALRNVRVYIDGNRLVGYLVPDIDTALGVRQSAALRGAIV